MTDMGRLIEPVIPGLRRYANALVRDRAEADDLVQDCLERAVARWGQRRADSDTRSWLYAILHNLAVSRWRALRRRGTMAPIQTVDPAFLSMAPTQEHELARSDVLRALDQLPDEQRAVILLVTVEGLSYDETARILSVPLGTVMSRLSRGRARLASAMADDGPVRSHLRAVK
ncbi:RNA polymerase sigma factor [Phenylobacterium sp.]|uniref:RNA polymerase sigma factor n=1 Tax=Phenylobacterium sp. TaxID=1871053 RepID=UPI0035C86E05